MSLPDRTRRCCNLVGATFHIPGDVVELGVSTGVTSINMGLKLRELGSKKKIYAFDTYEGLPYDGGLHDADLRKGECSSTLDHFLKEIQANGLEDIIIPVVGLVEKTLPVFLKKHKVAFAFLDMDLYAPTSFASKALIPRMELGAIIGYHDYGFIRCPGIKRVVDDEVRSLNIFAQMNDTSFDCVFLSKIRPHVIEQPSFSVVR